MTRHRGPPSQTWRTFLRNHADAIAAIDLCVAPTLTFGRLLRFWSWVMVVAVTRHPTSEWLAHQIVEAFPWNAAPTHLGATMMAPMDGPSPIASAAMGIRDRPISPRSPWQKSQC